MLPVKIPLRMREHSTAGYALTLRDDAGVELDLTGYSAYAAVKKSPSDEVAAITFVCTITGGRITFKPAAPNNAPVGRYVWDLILTQDDELLPIAGGPLELFAGVAVVPDGD